jgi:hypothetical protein
MLNNPTKESSRSSPPDSKADNKSLGKLAVPENLIEQHSLSQTRSMPEQRHERIAVVAYRLAESREFGPGGELEDWLRAEAEVDRASAKAPVE